MTRATRITATALALVLAPAIALAPGRLAAEQVKTADAACKSAYALLGWSMFDVQAAEAKAKKEQARANKEAAKTRKEKSRWAIEEHDWEQREQHWEFEKKQPWVKVGWILGRRKYLKRTSNVEEGVAQQVAFAQFHVKGKDGAYAYVARCGAGLTCNEVAATFNHIYKAIGTPRVECGPLPDVLVDGAEPEIPIPSDEELAKADADSGDEIDDEDDAKDKDASKDKAEKDKKKKADDDDEDKPKEKPKKDDKGKKSKGKDKDDDDDE